ncbi:MAG: hypothetical protein R3236_08475, partial [Phycisphaeraceae bacterium]|nr:hypothetical protein [Phycisphaeraceae bacterium]
NLMLINWLKDPERFTKTLDKFEAFVNQQLARQSDGETDFKIQHKQEDNLTIRYLQFPMVNPSWAVHKGRLLIALSPQALSARAQLDKTEGHSIMDRPEFTQLLEKLGDRPYNGVSFTDLPQTAPQTMEQFTGIASAFATFSSGDGPKIDPMQFLPPLGKMLPHLEPSMSISWSDKNGYAASSLSPFPMSDLLGPSSGQSSALGVAILLPALARAREVANRTASLANLSGMYKSMYTYSVSNKDQFPPDLGTMVKDGSISLRMVVNPNSGTSIPDEFTRGPYTPAKLQKMADWANANSDYVYITGKGANMRADDIVMYEKFGPDAEGVGILYGDGHAEFVTLDLVIQEFKRLNIPLPAGVQ